MLRKTLSCRCKSGRFSRECSLSAGAVPAEPPLQEDPLPSAAVFSVLCLMLPAFPGGNPATGVRHQEVQEPRGLGSLPPAKALLSVPNARASVPPSDFITAGAGK